MKMADVRVLHLTQVGEFPINIVEDGGFLIFYTDGELLTKLCEPHLDAYNVVQVDKGDVQDMDTMTSPFGCEEEQIHIEFLFDFLRRFEHYIDQNRHMALAVERFTELYNFFLERGSI